MTLALAACASPSTDYPSLAIRDAERLVGVEQESAPPAPLAPIPADVMQQVGAYQAKASRADEEFRGTLPRVERTVSAARGSGIASDRWSNAQIALSELDALRATTAIALADLDALYAARAVELERRDAIDEARGEVSAILSRQDTTLNRLKAQLPQ